jgi:hypothetical protein
MERAGDEDVEVGRERLKEREGMERRKKQRRKGSWDKEEEIGPAIFQTDRRH